MTNSVTHFEMYGEGPAKLADFYRNVFGWDSRANARSQLLAYSDWLGRTQGIAWRADLPRDSRFEWLVLFVNVTALDETIALVQKVGGSIVCPKTAVPKTAWVTILADPAKNIFGAWQADPTAFPSSEPDLSRITFKGPSSTTKWLY